MAPGTKPPNSHQTRPPLTSRIRASFEGKRSKSVSRGESGSRGGDVPNPLNQNPLSPRTASTGSPTVNGFFVPDADTLRDAIDQAVCSEAFQAAIATNLAKLIKPSIKSALDTIQPLVEAVYTHEMLLRKTNQSLERIESNTNASRRTSKVDPDEGSQVARMLADPIPTEEGETTPVPREMFAGGAGPDLEQFRNLIEANNSNTIVTLARLSAAIAGSNGKIAEVQQGVHDISASLGPTKETVEGLKTITEESNTTVSALQAQLDQLKADISQIMEAIGTDLGKNVQALHERSVSKPETSFLTEHTTKLDLISTDLAALRGDVDTSEKLDSITTELTALKGCVEGGIAANAEGFSTLGVQITSVNTALESNTATLGELKETLFPAHPDLLAAIQQSNDSHASHTTFLTELKERPTPPQGEGESTASRDILPVLEGLKTDLASLKENIEAGFSASGARVDTILTTIEGHPHAEILAETQKANESHVSHAAVLEELKVREITPASSEAIDLAILDPKFEGLSTILDTHSAAFEDLKGLCAAHATIIEGHGVVLQEIKSREVAPAASEAPDLSGLSSTLDAHTATLEEIKTLHGAHATVLDEIKTKEVTSASGEAVDLSGLTTTLDAHTAVLDEIKTLHGAHATALDGHSTILEELKSRENGPAQADSAASLEPQITTIINTLEAHTSVLDTLKPSSGAHTTALEGYGTALDGIESLSPTDAAPSNVDLGTLEVQIAAILGTLETHTANLNAIKASGTSHSTALETHGAALDNIKSLGSSETPAAEDGSLSNIEAQVTAIVEMLQTHTAALVELKGTRNSHATAPTESRSIELASTVEGSNPDELESKVEAIMRTLETHTTILSELKTNSTSHTTVLSDLEDLHTAHASALDDIRSPGLPPMASIGLPDTTNLAALEIQIGGMVNTLNTHTGALSEIGARVGASNAALLTANDGDVPNDANLNTVLEILDAHTQALNEIREDVAAEILTAMHNLDQKQENHTNLLMEIRESDLNDEILTLLHKDDESHTGHVVVLQKIMDGINGLSESHVAHKEVLEDIKSKGIATEGDTPPTVDFSALEAQLAAMQTILEEHNAALTIIKNTTAASHELHLTHSSALDEIKTRAVETAAPTAPEIPSFEGIESKIDSLITSFSEHQASLAHIQEMTNTLPDLHAAHTASLDELKTRSIDIPAANFGELEGKIDGIVGALEEHKATLLSVHENTNTANEMHASHVTSLDELKSRSVDPIDVSAPIPGVDLSSLETQIAGIVASLEEHKTALATIQEHTSAAHDLHASHNASLVELRPRSIENGDSSAPVDLSSLETRISEIKTALEEHNSALKDIQESTNAANELHASHTSNFEELKTRSLETGISPSNVDLSSLETQIASLAASLEEHKTALVTIQETTTAANELHASHTANLEDLKTRSIVPEVTPSPAVDLSGLAGQLSGLVASLEEHKATLTSLQEHAVTHSASLDEIKSRPAGSEPASIDFSGLENQITGIVASLEEHKVALAAIQEHAATHATSLDEIKSRAVDHESVTAGTVDLSALEAQIGSVSASLEEHKTMLAAIQEHSASHAAGLDEMKAKVVDPEQVSRIIASLEEHKASLTAIHEATSTHGGYLEEIKSRSLDPEQLGVITNNLEDHKTSLALIHDTLTAHEGHLEEIKYKSVDAAQIGALAANLEDHKLALAAIQETTTSSYGLHVANAGSLDEIKSRSLDVAPTSEAPLSMNTEALEAQITSIIATLQQQKTSLAELTELNGSFYDSHASHAGILREIKDEAMKSNTFHVEHAAILATLKPREPEEKEPGSPDLSALETHLTTILTNLESQSSLLAEIKDKPDVVPSPEILVAIKQSHDLLIANQELLNSHTGLLGAIKEGTNHEDILVNLSELKTLVESHKSDLEGHGELVRGLHEDTKYKHEGLMGAIAGLAIGGAAGTGATVLLDNDDNTAPNKELLEKVAAIHEIVSSTKSQIDINHTTITTSITSLGDEVKSEIDASATNLGESISAIHTDIQAIDLAPLDTKIEEHHAMIGGKLDGINDSVKAVDLTPVHAALELHGSALNAFGAQVTDMHGSVKAIDLNPMHQALAEHNSIMSGISGQLDNGVHFNDSGISQLKAQNNSQPRSSSMSEGAWFKRTSSIERSVPVEAPLQSEDDKDGHSGAMIGAAAAGALALGGAAAIAVHEHHEDDGREGEEADLSPIQEEHEVEHNEPPVDSQELAEAQDAETVPGPQEVDKEEQTAPEIEAAESDIVADEITIPESEILDAEVPEQSAETEDGAEPQEVLNAPDITVDHSPVDEEDLNEAIPESDIAVSEDIAEPVSEESHELQPESEEVPEDLVDDQESREIEVPLEVYEADTNEPPTTNEEIQEESAENLERDPTTVIESEEPESQIAEAPTDIKEGNEIESELEIQEYAEPEINSDSPEHENADKAFEEEVTAVDEVVADETLEAHDETGQARDIEHEPENSEGQESVVPTAEVSEESTPIEDIVVEFPAVVHSEETLEPESVEPELMDEKKNIESTEMQDAQDDAVPEVPRGIEDLDGEQEAKSSEVIDGPEPNQEPVIEDPEFDQDIPDEPEPILEPFVEPEPSEDVQGIESELESQNIEPKASHDDNIELPENAKEEEDTTVEAPFYHEIDESEPIGVDDLSDEPERLIEKEDKSEPALEIEKAMDGLPEVDESENVHEAAETIPEIPVKEDLEVTNDQHVLRESAALDGPQAEGEGVSHSVDVGENSQKTLIEPEFPIVQNDEEEMPISEEQVESQEDVTPAQSIDEPLQASQEIIESDPIHEPERSSDLEDTPKIAAEIHKLFDDQEDDVDIDDSTIREATRSIEQPEEIPEDEPIFEHETSQVDNASGPMEIEQPIEEAHEYVVGEEVDMSEPQATNKDIGNDQDILEDKEIDNSQYLEESAGIEQSAPSVLLKSSHSETPEHIVHTEGEQPNHEDDPIKTEDGEDDNSHLESHELPHDTADTYDEVDSDFPEEHEDTQLPDESELLEDSQFSEQDFIDDSEDPTEFRRMVEEHESPSKAPQLDPFGASHDETEHHEFTELEENQESVTPTGKGSLARDDHPGIDDPFSSDHEPEMSLPSHPQVQHFSSPSFSSFPMSQCQLDDQ